MYLLPSQTMVVSLFVLLLVLVCSSLAVARKKKSGLRNGLDSLVDTFFVARRVRVGRRTLFSLEAPVEVLASTVDVVDLFARGQVTRAAFWTFAEDRTAALRAAYGAKTHGGVIERRKPRAICGAASDRQAALVQAWHRLRPAKRKEYTSAVRRRCDGNRLDQVCADLRAAALGELGGTSRDDQLEVGNNGGGTDENRADPAKRHPRKRTASGRESPEAGADSYDAKAMALRKRARHALVVLPTATRSQPGQPVALMPITPEPPLLARYGGIDRTPTALEPVSAEACRGRVSRRNRLAGVQARMDAACPSSDLDGQLGSGGDAAAGNGGEPVCVICLEPPPAEPRLGVDLACGHGFCCDCIVRHALEVRSACPVCRRAFVAITCRDGTRIPLGSCTRLRDDAASAERTAYVRLLAQARTLFA